MKRYVTCPECNGKTTIYSPYDKAFSSITCPSCNGKGEVSNFLAVTIKQELEDNVASDIVPTVLSGLAAMAAASVTLNPFAALGAYMATYAATRKKRTVE